MSDHVLDLLGAYLDGELHGGQLRRVVAHLDECRSCLDEFQALQTLSTALHEVPVPDFPAPERLASEVALRLARDPVKPMRYRFLEFGWWLAPVGLILAWIFISTSLVVSEMVTAANDLGLLGSTSAWLVSGAAARADYSAFLGSLGVLDPGSLPWFTLSESFTRTLISNTTWQVSITLLYLSWMAISWVRHAGQGRGQSPGSGRVPTVK
jgi:predicted anti-sigma-YlaC factor YlaD